MREETDIMSYWDCKQCGTKKIKGTSRDCPSCGMPRGKDVKFYMSGPDIELTEEAIPILEKISIEIDKINQVLFKDIPTKDIQCMIDTMNKMNEKIEGAK